MEGAAVRDCQLQIRRKGRMTASTTDKQQAGRISNEGESGNQGLCTSFAMKEFALAAQRRAGMEVKKGSSLPGF